MTLSDSLYPLKIEKYFLECFDLCLAHSEKALQPFIYIIQYYSEFKM